MTDEAQPQPPWRVAVVNRGEAAMRLINAVRELRHETGSNITAVALHTAAERTAMFVREADEAVCIQPVDPTITTPYLDLASLRAGLLAARADAAWVGWGFVAERPEFAELCDELDVVFVGPRADVMRRLGDKIGAKLLAEEAGVPVAPWSGGPVADAAAASEHAARIGYPLMIKASAGGGGRGIRRVDDESQLAEAFESARNEGAKAFGDATVFMEQVVSGARHVEVQLIADEHGTAWALGVRDCSLQRRNQKVMEESHCIAISPAQDAALRAAAVRLAELAGYTNAGTVEFLYSPVAGGDERGNGDDDHTLGEGFAFLEVNTRLQVEHPVTELTTGVDIVKLQLHVAAGGRLDGTPPASSGYAIEARLNAEDPQNGFTPAPGTIDTLVFPVGPGVRVDTGVAAGDLIPPDYDSMIAKVIAVGRDRGEALARLQRALQQTVALVDGGTTNKSFLLGLLDRPEVRDGTFDTSWLDALTASGDHVPTKFSDVALLAAGIAVADEARAVEVERFLEVAARGRPGVDVSIGREIELRHDNVQYRLVVRQLAAGHHAVRLGDDEVISKVERLGRVKSRLVAGGATHVIVARDLARGDDSDALIEVDGVVHRFSRDAAGAVRAPAAALVVGVDVVAGQNVSAGDRLAVVEAMKMEIAISAPIAGVVGDVFVTRNTQVDAGAALVRIEPLPAERDGGGARGAGAAAEPITFTVLARRSDNGVSVGRRVEEAAATLRSFMLGFDVATGDATAAAAALVAARGDGIDAFDADLAALGAFGDLCSLSPERRTPDGNESASPREYFNAYVRTLDPEREGLPAWFVDRLERALRHYGVSLPTTGADADDDTALGEALMRIFAATRRRDEQLGVVAALLDDRLVGAAHVEAPARAASVRDTLDRLIESTQRRHPAIASLARGVRYRAFDRPAIEQHRAEVSTEMRAVVDRVMTNGVDASGDLETLIACPLPLMAIFSEGDRFAGAPNPGPLLEVLTRRYYKIRSLGAVAHRDVAGYHVIRTDYAHNDRVVDVAALRCGPTTVAHALRAATESLADTELPNTAVIDLYVTAPGGNTAPIDQLSTVIAAALDEVELPALVRRVAVIAARDGASSQQLTFRRAGADGVRPYWMLNQIGDDENGRPDRFAEDVKFRGLHPMIARRLQMWRLSNFDISRLPSADDVYAFECVARENPSDVRLIAVAEVRDLTPARDESGKVIALPGVEHVLVGCLDSIRQSLGSRPDAARLEWNRVMLYVWPTAEFSLGEVNDIVRRLAPLTEGLGIEQIVVSARFARTPDAGEWEATEPDADDVVLRLGYEPGRGLTARFTPPPDAPMQPLDDYTRKRIQTRRRGLVYPYDLVGILTRGGTFHEYDLDARSPEGADTLMPVDRPPGRNRAGVVVGVVTSPSPHHRGGITRVVIAGDPTKAMGSIAEAECRRILGAIDLAIELDVPVEWLALSAGAKIAMDSGSENLDWVARVLRRLVEATQTSADGRRGLEVNVVVAGINVGAQPYWNAEATMLMHTAGILVMTPDSAMVLTGKQAIDYSGGVSAEDNLGIGGYGRIMGPNGEAQYFAPTIAAACDVLFRHYELTYVTPGSRWAPTVPTADPFERDVRSWPHRADGTDFATVGEIFSAATNKDRKKPFDARTVMRAVIDADHPPLERWAEMADAETAIVYDARLGGHAVSVIGIESRPLPRHGVTPADGPAQWSAGTLFPLSSKKVARAINAASGRRPVVALANLSGFDGSPESLRRLQLEYGAEIGRAIVNFDGPFVLCVISRYHGGAFVVFSATLNDQMEVLAVDGSFASVIGGAPAAAVVFTRDVDERTRSDERVRAAEAALAAAAAHEVDLLRAELADTYERVRTDKLGEVAAEFDAIHSVERAKDVGSVHRTVAPERLRPELIAAVERGVNRWSSAP